MTSLHGNSTLTSMFPFLPAPSGWRESRGVFLIKLALDVEPALLSWRWICAVVIKREDVTSLPLWKVKYLSPLSFCPLSFSRQSKGSGQRSCRHCHNSRRGPAWTSNTARWKLLSGLKRIRIFQIGMRVLGSSY